MSAEIEAGWVLLIVSCLAWVGTWIIEFHERKKIDEQQWRDARVRMGLPQEYKGNIRVSR